MKLLLATRSVDKAAEIRRILAVVPGLELLDLTTAGIPETEEEEGIEAFETFEENAAAKARYFARQSGLATVADDSGLVVDPLDGRPGVRSKRFSPRGRVLSGLERDRANNEYLLELLGDLALSRRTARYVCVAALVGGEQGDASFRGEAEGLILGRPRGSEGFGYDPLFFDPALGRTFAEIPREEKNRRSHRGRAFQAVAEHLRTLQAGVHGTGGADWP